jgi:hypothetical protein
MQLQRDLPILFVILILIVILSYFPDEIDALSPNFPRQVILDGSNDWYSKNFLSNPSSNFNSSQCKED